MRPSRCVSSVSSLRTPFCSRHTLLSVHPAWPPLASPSGASFSFSLSFLQAYILPHVPCHTFVLFLLTVSFAKIAFALSFECPHVPILLHLAETSLQMAPSRGLCIRIAPFPLCLSFLSHMVQNHLVPISPSCSVLIDSIWKS